MKLHSSFFLLLFLISPVVYSQVSLTGANPATPNGNYPTLQAAFAAINSNNQNGLNIQIAVTANTVETATAVLTLNPGPWTSMLISPVGARTVTGNIAGPLIDFSGAGNVLVDGLNDGVNSLVLVNTSASSFASTLRFINDAALITVTRCTINGSSKGIPNNAGEGAVVFIAGSSVPSPAGNDNITISNNDIGNSSSVLPNIGVKGYNSTSTNNNVIITGNKIHDFFSFGNSYSRGVYAGQGSSSWTISSNRIFQTATRTWNAGGPNVYSCIDVQNTIFGITSNMVIDGNILGYQSASGTGYSVFNSASNIASNIHAIIFNAAGSLNNTISNNVISGFDLKSSRATGTAGENIFIGIYVPQGEIDITGNTIGSASIPNAIIIRSTAVLTAPTPVPAAGIYVRGTSEANIISNTLGGFTFTFESPGTSNISEKISFHGIFSDNTNMVNIRNNKIGGDINNSIQLPYPFARISGIHCSGGAVTKITENKIQNIRHSGIRVTSPGASANIIGIYLAPSNTADSIARDTIINLVSSGLTTSGTKCIIGIYISGSPIFPARIVKNVINSFSVQNGPGGYLAGIHHYSGRVKMITNMIALGQSQTTNDQIFGVDQMPGTNAESYFNSVYISGTSTSTAISAAYRLTGSSSLISGLVSKNNVIYSDRNNITYGMLVGTYSNYTGSNNLIYANRLGSYQGSTHLTLQNWYASTGHDNPIVSKSAPVTFASPVDLHSTDLDVRNCGILISDVTDDIDGFPQGTCIDIGCDETDVTVLPASDYIWLGGVSNVWCTGCNWDRDIVPPVNSNVIIKENCPKYPLLQSSCGNQTVNDFTMLGYPVASMSSKMDVGAYALTVNGNINITGTCLCSGVGPASLITQGLIDVTSTISQQILDIRNSFGVYPGEICKLRINKSAPGAVPSNVQEALLKGNLRILLHIDFSNGVLLSQSGIGYDADENTAANFKTITVINASPSSVTRQNIPVCNTRNGFFEGRINRHIQSGLGLKEYLYPLGFRQSGGIGVLSDYFYTPALVTFSNVTSSNYLAGTYLNLNNNFTVDGSSIGFSGHGCFNPLEINDQNGATAVSCLGKEIDMVAFHYWDFSESDGMLTNGDPDIQAGALGSFSYDIQVAGDVFSLPAVDGLSGSELRILNRPSVILPGNAGQGTWVTTSGTHSGIPISLNSGISQYSIAALQAARRNGLTQFGGFGVAGNGDSPLPVELLYFNAEKENNNSVRCYWATASEINSHYFIVESATEKDSEGNPLFRELGRVNASGNSTVTNYYSLYDSRNHSSGIVYYRLIQVDLDGKATSGTIVAVSFEPSVTLQYLGVHPNPTDGQIYVSLFVPQAATFNFTITDSRGRIMESKPVQLPEGLNKITLFENFVPSPGVYILSLKGKDSVITDKILVK